MKWPQTEKWIFEKKKKKKGKTKQRINPKLKNHSCYTHLAEKKFVKLSHTAALSSTVQFILFKVYLQSREMKNFRWPGYVFKNST